MAEPGQKGGRTHFLGFDFDGLDMRETLAWLEQRDPAASFVYLATPNVDHVVRMAEEPVSSPQWAAYRAAELCLCDSRILARLAKLRGVDLSVVPGSDLTARVIADYIRPGDRLCLVGGDAEMAEQLGRLLSTCEILQHIPPMGMRHKPEAMAEAAEFMIAARARFTFIATGSPQQELLAQQVLDSGRATGIGLCIGASLEFVTGRKARAPQWMRRLEIEWLHRLLSEPRRLWRRYLVEGPKVFALTMKAGKRR